MEIQLLQTDITKLEVDAIVNAANSSLLGGGGVDGAIHRAGGPDILEACMAIRNKQGGCATGGAVMTTAGQMPSTFVIHTVGPIWNDKQKEKKCELLKSCYRKSLELAALHQVESIAFPNISTGVYRFPKRLAAQIAVEEVRAFAQMESSIQKVYFVCFDAENFQIYSQEL